MNKVILEAAIATAIQRELNAREFNFTRDKTTIVEEVADELLMWVSEACLTKEKGLYSKRLHDEIGDPAFMSVSSDAICQEGLFNHALDLKEQLERELESLGRKIVLRTKETQDFQQHIESRKKKK